MFLHNVPKAMVLSYNDRMIPMTYCYDNIDLSIRPFKNYKIKILVFGPCFRNI